MKKALISPIEPVLSGYRVAEVADNDFPVADPLFWIDCSDEIVADQYYFDPSSEEILIVPQEPKDIIPSVVSMRQARLALLAAGHLETVNNAISSMEQASQIEWEYATEVKRNSPLVASLATLLNLSPEDLDSLFVTASTL
jgi:hypothetical protein